MNEELLVSPYFHSKETLERLEFYSEDFSSGDTLFLSYLNDKKDKMYKNNVQMLIYRVTYEFLQSTQISYSNDETILLYSTLKDRSISLLNALQALDIGISNIEVVNLELKDTRSKFSNHFLNTIKYDLYTQRYFKTSYSCTVGKISIHLN